MISTNQMKGGGRGTLGDANAPDPPDKSQAMEGDLVGALVGEKRGRELELGEEDDWSGWVVSGPHKPYPRGPSGQSPRR